MKSVNLNILKAAINRADFYAKSSFGSRQPILSYKHIDFKESLLIVFLSISAYRTGERVCSDDKV